MRRGRRTATVSVEDDVDANWYPAAGAPAPGDTFDPFGADFSYDPTKFGSVSLIFGAVMQVVTGGTAKARLFNVTDAAVVAGSEVVTTSTSEVEVEATVTLPATLKTYRFEVGGLSGNNYRHHRCRLDAVD